MQSSLSVRMTEGRTAQGFLHRAQGNSDTLIVLLHGHNASGNWGKMVTMAKWFEHNSIDVLRWSAVRKQVEESVYAVSNVTEEYEQAKALLDSLRRNYKRVVVVGHSQGAMIGLRLCIEGLAHAYIALMGVGDTNASLKRKITHLGLPQAVLSVETYPTNPKPRLTMTNGVQFEYEADFFTDFASWNIPAMLAQWNGPSLFVAGEQDTMIPASEVEHASKTVRGESKYLTIADNHSFSEESAVMLAGVIVNWLREQ
jgi:pimeloyl-ACP methyl ester carboxylesterase